MVFAFSNAGLDVNMQNSKGNTALHLAFQRGYTEVGFTFIEVLDFLLNSSNYSNISF